MAAVKISGVLRDGTGKPVPGCIIELKAKRTSETVIATTVAYGMPEETGSYSMDVEPNIQGDTQYRRLPSFVCGRYRGQGGFFTGNTE